MKGCHLCKSYIHDTLDSPPVKTPKGAAVSNSKLLREAIPGLYDAIQVILSTYEPELITHISMVDNDMEILRILMTNAGFLAEIEEAIEWLARTKGFRVRKARDWFLNKVVLVLRTIHGVHTEHMMLPIKHRERLEAIAAKPVAVQETFIEVSMSGRPGGLRIKIPDECELYC